MRKVLAFTVLLLVSMVPMVSAETKHDCETHPTDVPSVHTYHGQGSCGNTDGTDIFAEICSAWCEGTCPGGFWDANQECAFGATDLNCSLHGAIRCASG